MDAVWRRAGAVRRPRRRQAAGGGASSEAASLVPLTAHGGDLGGGVHGGGVANRQSAK